ncbi:MAG: ribonuclease III [Geobacteraceae bacterium]|nr:ribonuclease III [Geobacteraceae bacterium]
MLQKSLKSTQPHLKRALLLSQLEKDIDYRFTNRRFLFEALIHSSYAAVSRRRGIPDNQRLAFFGNSVLGFLISHWLMELFPESSEGELSRRKASLVDTTTLSGFALKLDLGRYLLLSRGEINTGGRTKKTVLAAAFEALLAAIYLDGGSPRAEHFVKRMYGPLLADESVEDDYRDYKTKLQELAHSLHSQVPCYFLNKIEGPDHNLSFTVTVMAGNECFARGTGKTRREAEQHAARECLVLLEEIAVRTKSEELSAQKTSAPEHKRGCDL